MYIPGREFAVLLFRLGSKFMAKYALSDVALGLNSCCYAANHFQS